jgi:hypothetical protein
VQEDLCERVLTLDHNIRFVGIINNKGEVISGGFQEGVEPLLSGSDEQEMYVQSLSNMVLHQNFSHKLGTVKYSITEHQNIVLMTFPLGDRILCLSTSSEANTFDIKNEILKLIGNSLKEESTNYMGRKNEILK